MSISIYIFLLIELLAVSYGDLKYQKISNLWAIFNLILFVILIFIFKETYSFSFDTWFYSIVFFGVGFLLFTLNVMGGGDSKFIASFFLLIPHDYQNKFFESLLWVTVTVGIVLIIVNTYKGRGILMEFLKYKKISSLKEVYGTKLTYAPVILASWLIFGYIIEVWNF